jgi:hypothetical protein
MKTYGGVEVYLHHSLPQQQMEVNGQLHVPAALLPRKPPAVPIGCEAGWASKTVWTLRGSGKSCPCLELNSEYPARSPSQYRLSYPEFNVT